MGNCRKELHETKVILKIMSRKQYILPTGIIWVLPFLTPSPIGEGRSEVIKKTKTQIMTT